MPDPRHRSAGPATATVPLSQPRQPRHRLVRAAALGTGAALSAALLSLAPTPTLGATFGPELAVNGSFESQTTGWTAKGAGATLRSQTGGTAGSRSVAVSSTSTTTVLLNDDEPTVPTTQAGTRYAVSANVRASAPDTSGQLRVREVHSAGTVTHGRSFWLEDTAWHPVDLALETTRSGAALDLNVLAWDLPAGRALSVDEVSMRRIEESAPPTPQTPGTLSNGCAYGKRGIPACGAYFGAAVGGNTDPAAFESEMGRRLGVRRTYFGPTQVDRAVSTAKADLAKGRLPWISLKLPESWARMASGAGDAWATDLARRLARLNGPVWVAFHHEPEGDGAIRNWTRMQERLGPILRANAPNAAFTVVTTGWNQLYGPARYRLENIWPDTKVDVAGFDVYSFAYTYKDGVLRTTPMNIEADYFQPFQAWSAEVGTRWALAETGYTHLAAQHDPDWLRQTHAEMIATKGIAMAYFNSDLNTTETLTNLTVTTAPKRNDFSLTLRSSPVIPPLPQG